MTHAESFCPLGDPPNYGRNVNYPVRQGRTMYVKMRIDSLVINLKLKR
jgi:hypothetical protein